MALPITAIPEVPDDTPVGTDVTDMIGVRYAVEEDNIRKAKADPDAKYKSMAARHKDLAKKSWFRWLMKRNWGKKLLFFFFGKKKDNPKGFPSWITKTDEVRCLTSDAKIATDQGIIRLGKIVNDRLDVKVKSYNLKTGECEYKNITDYQLLGREKIINIKYKKRLFIGGTYTSRNIQSIDCSYDHMLYTDKGYKKAEDITTSDRLMFMYDNCIEDDAISLLYGFLIGDSHFTPEVGSVRITFTHGEKQREYLLEKLRLLCNSNMKIRTGKSGYCDNRIYMGHTRSYENLLRCLYEDNAIIDGKLVKTKEFCDRLTPMSLAFWYLDDGSIRHKDDDLSPTIEFSTHSESAEEVKNLMEALQHFGIESKRNNCYRNSKFLGYSIRLNADDTYNFLELIKNYIPYCMRYKTISKFEDEEYILANKTFQYVSKMYPVDIISVEDNGYANLYDITVEDNHNFFANDVLNHNCENAPFYLDGDEEWLMTEKLDGTSCTFALKHLKGNKYDFVVCSRNVRQMNRDQETYHDTNIYWELADAYNIEMVLRHCMASKGCETLVLQGEGVGNVQGNPYKLKENDLYCFNLYVDGVRTSTLELKEFCDYYGLKCVPIIEVLHKLPKTMEEMKLEADGYSVINPKVRREGLVYRSQDGQKSFKNVSREYLLRHSN